VIRFEEVEASMFIESDLTERTEELFDMEVLHGVACAFFEGFDEIL
jgi:hypothetical protein